MSTRISVGSEILILDLSWRYRAEETAFRSYLYQNHPSHRDQILYSHQKQKKAEMFQSMMPASLQGQYKMKE
jgi:arginine deiminase